MNSKSTTETSVPRHFEFAQELFFIRTSFVQLYLIASSFYGKYEMTHTSIIMIRARLSKKHALKVFQLIIRKRYFSDINITRFSIVCCPLLIFQVPCNIKKKTHTKKLNVKSVLFFFNY